MLFLGNEDEVQEGHPSPVRHKHTLLDGDAREGKMEKRYLVVVRGAEDAVDDHVPSLVEREDVLPCRGRGAHLIE